MTNLKKELLEEIKKIETALAAEKNLNQISFYEGYLKGLRFIDLDKYAEFVVREYKENCKGCGKTRCDCGKTHNEPYSGFDAVE